MRQVAHGARYKLFLRMKKEVRRVKIWGRALYTTACVAVILVGSLSGVGGARRAAPSAAPEPDTPGTEAAVPAVLPVQTRAEAAAEAYDELLALGWNSPSDSASLAMFADAAEVPPGARTAAAQLCVLGAMPVSGAFLRPNEPISEADALALHENVRLAAEGKLDPLAALGERREVTLEACRSLCAAMLTLGLDRFDGEPDARLATCAVGFAAFSGLFEGCTVSDADARLTREGLAAALSLIFAENAPDQPDPTAFDPPPEVHGDTVSFPRRDDAFTITPGALVPDNAGGARLWCSVREGGIYRCTALIYLYDGRAAAAVLSFG